MKMQLYAAMLLCALTSISRAQDLKGRVVHAITYQPVAGVSLASGKNATLTNESGSFVLAGVKQNDTLKATCIGYQTAVRVIGAGQIVIALTPAFVNLDEIVISGNREGQRRSEVPVAINVVTKAIINETKATRLDMLINKVPGVFMVDLGNEQHSMSVRQPLGYNNLFLYLEDGIPIRTVGDFNHNALIEINQASLGRIEVIKGPASSLYGSEAVGGAINFITQEPSAVASAKVQVETSSRGYRRADINYSNSVKKLGIFAGGYVVRQDQPATEHNDFNKTALTLRADYNFNDRTKLVAVADYIRYNTDQKGGLDSAHFYSNDYSSVYRFTYRKVDAFRARTTLSTQWNDHAKTSFTLLYRNSAIGQNPFYSISNTAGNANAAVGQINEDAFRSYSAVVQHTQKFNRIKASWITGLSMDFSPASYFANHINISRSSGVYTTYRYTDSMLTNYDVDLVNSAAYTQFEYSPTQKLKFVAAARYDRLDYRFDNHLPPGAFTGAPDASDHFDHFTPKIGATYSLGKGRGLYANYSVGFAPPNITDLYRGVQVPVLKPSSYNNYEIGGWMPFDGIKGYAEISIYQLDGTNEIISVRLPDGTYANQNAGATSHRGLEFSIRYSPVRDLQVRFGGACADHQYIDYQQQGKDLSGNKMSQAPTCIFNGEAMYKPGFLKGFRIALEYQGMNGYYTDAQNTERYKGFNVYNLRLGYTIKATELWVNCLNVADKVYATTVEKSAYGTSYRPGQLRTINVGVAYNFVKR